MSGFHHDLLSGYGGAASESGRSASALTTYIRLVTDEVPCHGDSMRQEGQQQERSAREQAVAEPLASAPSDGGEQQMDIHKPKPIHSWRELLGEIGVIVIGVLIALGAEQVVETLHWREKASQAREALSDEALENYNSSAERVVLAPCLNAQLDQLKARVLEAGTRLVPMTPIKSPIGLTVYRHPSRLWTDAAWQSTVTEQVSSHLTVGERNNLAALYSSLSFIRELNRQEFVDDGQLMILAAPLPLDAGLRARLIETIETQRFRTNSMALIAQQQMERVRATFPHVAKTADRDWSSGRDHDIGTLAWCRANGLPLSEPR